jgi:hypothetical protein
LGRKKKKLKIKSHGTPKASRGSANGWFSHFLSPNKGWDWATPVFLFFLIYKNILVLLNKIRDVLVFLLALTLAFFWGTKICYNKLVCS